MTQKRLKSTERIPEYLLRYVVQQETALYTPMDHAAWRFILTLSKVFLGQHAHQKYLTGLVQTGISSDHIPSISEMDHCLRRFGWRAVAVSGFIPPPVFMEFLSLGVLPIACDMRKLENLAYTPAPDIVHEAAGHAPIVADPAYADYLRSYGEISRKAIFSKSDIEVYLAVRDLSETKEDPTATQLQIDRAQKRLDEITQKSEAQIASEATRLARMGWWTFEYGLVGTLRAPKIYGAGLLSSTSESFHCLGPEVKRLPFDLSCVETSYDITKPQPQLFVAPNFGALKRGLEALADQMAFRRGGVYGLETARSAGTTTTTVLDTGLQISGILSDFKASEPGRVDFIKLSGPVQLAFGDQVIEGHGTWTHAEGFSSPLGQVKIGSRWKSTSELSDREAQAGRLEFESGFILTGVYVGAKRIKKKNLILTFDQCRITHDGQTLYDPSWGRFDLACGARVASVFGGAADRMNYSDPTDQTDRLRGSVVRRQKSNLTAGNTKLNRIYDQLRTLRNQLERKSAARDAPLRAIPTLQEILTTLDTIEEGRMPRVPRDWLIRWELLDLAQWIRRKIRSRAEIPGLVALESRLRGELEQLKSTSETHRELIERGLKCVGLR